MNIKRYSTKIICALLAVAAGFVLSTHQAHASLTDMLGLSNIFGYGIKDFVIMMMADISYMILTIASWFVGLTGTLLNVAMYFTTHVGIFVNNTPVIYTVWRIIRDISSLILIFFILIAAIKMILNVSDPDFGNLIKNIIIMGVLINFSFFFTRVLIDASNIVSLQFFNAIAPTNSASMQCLPAVNGSAPDNDPCTNPAAAAKQLLTSGGLSDIFMSALKVTTWYDTSKQLNSDANGATDKVGSPVVKILLITVAGVVVMILAGLSFLAVAIVCIVRLGVLLLLLAFSPIWIAAYAIPNLKEFSDMWTKQFKAQLIFLPVYLCVMYVALRILTESNLTKITQSSPSGDLSDFINLFVGFTIIIFILNSPLLIAAKAAGGGSDWTKGMFNSMRKWTQAKTQTAFRSGWMNTGGRAASAIARSEGLKNLASRSIVTEYALKGLNATGAKYGQKLQSQVKARTDYANSLGFDQNAVAREQAIIRQTRANIASGVTTKALGDIAIRAAQTRIDNLKTARQSNYADRIGSRGLDTLFMRYRKNKVGAAQIHLGVYEGQMKKHKADMTSIDKEINKINAQINGRQQRGVPQPAQTASLNNLATRKNALQGTIDALEAKIDQAKLTK